MGAMSCIDWTLPRQTGAAYSYAAFAAAKAWFFEQWCALAAERGLSVPNDLSGSCKYGSLFMQAVFGGSIRGHYEHQYNFIDGRVVDLSHDASDVGRMAQPYLHEPAYFLLPSLQASLAGCQPRAERWASEFLRGRAGTGAH
jgi:hypothetical protein